MRKANRAGGAQARERPSEVLPEAWANMGDAYRERLEEDVAARRQLLRAQIADLAKRHPRLHAAVNDPTYVTHDTSAAHADSTSGAAAQFCDSEQCAAFNVFHEIYQEDKLEQANIFWETSTVPIPPLSGPPRYQLAMPRSATRWDA